MECSDQGLAHKYMPYSLLSLLLYCFPLLSFWVRECLVKEETLRQKRGMRNPVPTSMTQIPGQIFILEVRLLFLLRVLVEYGSFLVEQAPWLLIIYSKHWLHPLYRGR